MSIFEFKRIKIEIKTNESWNSKINLWILKNIVQVQIKRMKVEIQRWKFKNESKIKAWLKT